MRKKWIVILSTCFAVLLLLTLCFTYINHFRLKPFNTDFITEIKITKDDKTITITNPEEVQALKKYFQGLSECLTYGHLEKPQ